MVPRVYNIKLWNVTNITNAMTVFHQISWALVFHINILHWKKFKSCNERCFPHQMPYTIMCNQIAVCYGHIRSDLLDGIGKNKTRFSRYSFIREDTNIVWILGKSNNAFNVLTIQTIHVSIDMLDSSFEISLCILYKN